MNQPVSWRILHHIEYVIEPKKLERRAKRNPNQYIGKTDEEIVASVKKPNFIISLIASPFKVAYYMLFDLLANSRMENPCSKNEGIINETAVFDAVNRRDRGSGPSVPLLYPVLMPKTGRILHLRIYIWYNTAEVSLRLTT